MLVSETSALNHLAKRLYSCIVLTMAYMGSEVHKKNLAKARTKAAESKACCRFCSIEMTTNGLPKHEKHCYLNPENTKLCPVCDSQIKNYQENETCSRRCSNILRPRREGLGYRSICFKNHERVCCVCGEDKIVEVHHLDGNHNNNDPANLVPLCPNHHQYWHSKYRHLIKDKVLKYMEEWSVRLDSNQRSQASRAHGENQTPPTHCYLVQ